MKRRYWFIFALPLLLSGYLGTPQDSAASQKHAGKINNGSEEILRIAENSPDTWGGYTNSSPPPTEHSADTNKPSSQPPVMSRKCGIYSGVCHMVRAAEVGSYCVCHTPAGINYGVIIP